MKILVFTLLGVVLILLCVVFSLCKRLDVLENESASVLHGILELTKARDAHAERLDKLEEAFDKVPGQDLSDNINAILEYDALKAAQRQRGVVNER